MKNLEERGSIEFGGVLSILIVHPSLLVLGLELFHHQFNDPRCLATL